jgi:hypothetical protein
MRVPHEITRLDAHPASAQSQFCDRACRAGLAGHCPPARERLIECALIPVVEIRHAVVRKTSESIFAVALVSEMRFR